MGAVAADAEGRRETLRAIQRIEDVERDVPRGEGPGCDRSQFQHGFQPGFDTLET